MRLFDVYIYSALQWKVNETEHLPTCKPRDVATRRVLGAI